MAEIRSSSPPSVSTSTTQLELFKDFDAKALAAQAEKADDAAKLAAAFEKAAQDQMTTRPVAPTTKITQAAETGTTTGGIAAQGEVKQTPTSFRLDHPDMAYAPPPTAMPTAMPSKQETEDTLGTPLQVPTAIEGGADAATSAAPVQASADPAPAQDDAPAGSYNRADLPMAIAMAEADKATAAGKLVTQASVSARAKQIAEAGAKEGGIFEVNGPAIASEYAAGARANGKEFSDEDEAELGAAIHNHALETGGLYRTGGSMAAFYKTMNLPGGEKFLPPSATATESGAGASSFFGSGAGSSWLGTAAKVALGVGAGALVLTNPILALIPGSASNVAMLGMGGMLATVGGLGSSASRQSTDSDPDGLSGVFKGATGAEDEIRGLMAQLALKTQGGQSLLSGSSSAGAMMQLGQAAGGTGLMGMAAGAGLSAVSMLGGFGNIPGMSSGGPQGLDGMLYGDSTNRMNADRSSLRRASSFLAATQNRSIDIDDLLMMFGAYVTTDGDADTREMMRRLAAQKQVESKQSLLDAQWKRARGKAEGTGKVIEGVASAVGSVAEPLGGGAIGGLIGGQISSAMTKPFDIAESSGAKAMAQNAISGQGMFSTDAETSDMLMLKVQSAVDKYKRNLELISNILKIRGQTGSSIINNIRA